MIASIIGRTFLKAYNTKSGTNWSAKEFFEKEYVKTFFDHPKYMMSGGNSPLENPKISWKNGITPSQEERKERIRKTIEKLESTHYDASIAIGYPASEKDEYSPTSGLITDLELPREVEDKYLSWIGSGFGCCVKGGISILFADEELLLDIYKGWSVYREILNDKILNKIRGNQIEAWNAQWLGFLHSRRNYRSDFDFNLFCRLNMFTVNETVVEVNTLNWSRLFFSISNKYPNSVFTGYVYSLGYKGNSTFGFYNFHFDKAKTLIDYYKKLFGGQAAIDDANDYEDLFGLKLYKACQFGVIGLLALQPASLFEDISKSNKINSIKFKTYKTWLLAMINKEETLELTGELATKLHLFEEGSKGTDRRALIEKLLQSGKRDFLNKWTEIVEKIATNELNDMKVISDKVFLMSQEEYGFFIALLKLDYRYQQEK